MGMLVDGVWTTDELGPDFKGRDGRFRRSESVFRNWVTRDGAPGPGGAGDFAAEADRYHLYVAITCPWAHRALLVRRLKGLDDAIGLSVVAPRRTDQGWVFDAGDARHRDSVDGAAALHELYTRADARYTGRVTVPVLWDKRRETIVSNESSEIIRMFNDAFTAFAHETPDLYPADMRAEIDALNERVYRTVNNGVYRAGFAATQASYEEAFDEVFATLDDLDDRLATRRYLTGERLTEADWRLFPTLVRFDVAYYGAFKCNKRRLVDYANLWAYVRELYQLPGVAETVAPETYKRGYYSISERRNPTGIVPKGPEIDFAAPHGRERVGAGAA
ncbi:MAG: glutathione S-transferase family protein [Rhodospirillales bacterium]|jgi:putative glutathione S-transferase|nr:glutathione S-transferase family protein [Rhodospirillales bacterium]